MIKESILCLTILMFSIVIANLLKRYRLYKLNKYYESLLKTKVALEKRYSMLEFEYNQYEL